MPYQNFNVHAMSVTKHTVETRLLAHACAHGVNSRALYAYIRGCAYNAVIFEPHPVIRCL